MHHGDLLFCIVTRLHREVEDLKNGTETSKTEAAVYRVLNKRLEAQLEQQAAEIKELRGEDRKRQRCEVELTSQRNVARHELDAVRRQVGELSRANAHLNQQVAALQGKRQKMRKLLREASANLTESDALEKIFNEMQEELKT